MRVNVVQQGQFWQVKKDTLHAPGTAFQTKREAIEAARKFGGEIVVYKANGDMEFFEVVMSSPVEDTVPVKSKEKTDVVIAKRKKRK